METFVKNNDTYLLQDLGMQKIKLWYGGGTWLAHCYYAIIFDGNYQYPINKIVHVTALNFNDEIPKTEKREFVDMTRLVDECNKLNIQLKEDLETQWYSSSHIQIK